MKNKFVVWALGTTIACAISAMPLMAAKKSSKGHRQFNLLAINDIYNVEGIDARQSGGFARFRELRKQLSSPGNDALVLHAGDFLFPSSMSSQFKGQQMIDIMNHIDGQPERFDERFFVVFGNHEFDKGKMKDAPMLAKRIEESDFYWLGTNIDFKPQATLPSQDFKKSLINNAMVTINGIQVGIYGLTTDIAIPAYASIDSHYAKISKRQVADLRARGAEVVIAVTHLKISQDKALLEQLGEHGPDAIFGGHEHNRQAICVGKRCVVKADADLRSAAVANVSVAPDGAVDISYRFSILEESTIDSDEQVLAKTDQWLARYQQEYCAAKKLPGGCLTEVFGKTAVRLIAEELEIRRFETNLGGYVADQMINAFDNIQLPGGRKIQASLINAGSLRLNQNIPAGSELNQWYLNGIFQYPVDLRVLEINGKILKQMVEHTIKDWSGNGWWLHVSGMAYRHDSINGKVSDISLLDKNGKATLVQDDETIVVVVNDYMADGSRSNQDGYTMLNLEQDVPYNGGTLMDLKQVVIDAIKAKWATGVGIAPKLPGRVCNNIRPELYCILDDQK